MRYIVIFIFSINLIFTGNVLHAQFKVIDNKESINITDEKGMKQGKWIVFGTAKPDTCYAPTSKVEEGLYQENRKTGIWEHYFCSGMTKSKTTFKNGRPDGYAVMYYENGKISEEGTWKINKWVGNYKLYYTNGQIQQEFSFNPLGKREGPQKYYHENGRVMIEGSWTAGKEAGVIKEYYETGDIKSETIYNNGQADMASIKSYEPKKPIHSGSHKQTVATTKKAVITKEESVQAVTTTKTPTILNGHYILYNKNKQKSKEGTFANNRLIDGKNYIYNENGVLIKVEIYKEGIYQGNGVLEE